MSFLDDSPRLIELDYTPSNTPDDVLHKTLGEIAQSSAPIAAAPPILRRPPAPPRREPVDRAPTIVDASLSEFVGAVVAWPAFGEIFADNLRQNFEKEGLPEDALPETMRRSTIAQRALKTATDGARVRLRTVHRNRVWDLVREDTSGAVGSSAGWVDLRATLTDSGLELAPSDHPAAEKIREEFRTLTESYIFQTPEISRLIIDMLRSWNAVPLNTSGGGTYFVPQERRGDLEKLNNALIMAQLRPGHRSYHELLIMPAARSLASVKDAAMRAMKKEALEIIVEIENEKAVKDENNDPFSEREAKTRLGRLAAAREKVTAYETLLEMPMDDLKERLKRLEIAINRVDADAASVERFRLLEYT